MKKTVYTFIFSFLLFNNTSLASTISYPTIFVHGIGDSSVAWKITGPQLSTYYEKYYKTDNHPFFMAGSGIGSNRDDKIFSNNLRNSCIYVTFNDYYDPPSNQVKELEKVIEDTIEEVWKNFPDYFTSKEEIKVNLVAHSMGGLVCRKYLVLHPQNHRVNMLITIDTPNLGTPVLRLKWAPYILDAGGIAGALIFSNPLLLGFTAIGIGADMFLHQGGIRLLSPAADSMIPDSKFLVELNNSPLPESIKYRAIISKATDPINRINNFILGFRQGGDGAVPVESQSLKYANIPNFKNLDYEEHVIDSPHFESFTKAAPKLSEILSEELVDVNR